MHLKPPFALLIIPVFVIYILERRWHSATLLAVPAMVVAAIILLLNHFEFGSPWDHVASVDRRIILGRCGWPAIFAEIRLFICCASYRDRVCCLASFFSRLSAGCGRAGLGAGTGLRAVFLFWNLERRDVL